MDRKLALISVPFDLDRPRQEMGRAPEALRAAGLASHLAEAGLSVARDQIIEGGLGTGSPAVRLGRLQARLAELVAEALGEGQLPVVIGGDCCNALGAWAGLTRARPHQTHGVIWLDAHGDWNTEETSRSGYLGGMPFAAICGYGNRDLRAAIGIDRSARIEHCLLVGGRDLDPPEAALLSTASLRRIALPSSGDDVRSARSALSGVDGIYLHLDLDVLDPTFAPGVSFPVPGGLGPSQVIDLAGALRADRPLICLTLAALNPGRDPTGLSVRTGLQILLGLLTL